MEKTMIPSLIFRMRSHVHLIWFFLGMVVRYNVAMFASYYALNVFTSSMWAMLATFSLFGSILLLAWANGEREKLPWV